MDFKQWILTEEQQRIVFTAWASNGTIIVVVNGKRYIYNVSAHLHPMLQKLARFKPFSALNKIKKIDPNPEIK